MFLRPPSASHSEATAAKRGLFLTDSLTDRPKDRVRLFLSSHRPSASVHVCKRRRRFLPSSRFVLRPAAAKGATIKRRRGDGLNFYELIACHSLRPLTAPFSIAAAASARAGHYGSGGGGKSKEREGRRNGEAGRRHLAGQKWERDRDGSDDQRFPFNSACTFAPIIC